MENLRKKEFYLDRRSKQLKQWERVIDRLISRTGKVTDQIEKELRHHIIKIQVKKARTEAILRQLQNEGNGNWNKIKDDFEKNWAELRVAILKASARPK